MVIEYNAAVMSCSRRIEIDEVDELEQLEGRGGVREEQQANNYLEEL